jgi:hypothetical protein
METIHGLPGGVLQQIDVAVAGITDDEVAARLLRALTDADRRLTAEPGAARFGELLRALGIQPRCRTGRVSSCRKNPGLRTGLG